MKINYNDSFYIQHKYQMGVRDEVSSINDTKWVDINERYERLRNTTSELLNEQPFNVVGNNKGFEKLIDLMGRSNYTFDDIDKSLIDTYKMSLNNAKSRNLVNTHAVMFSCDNTSSCVSIDKFTNYNIIDAPFNQMHFGERDEFIRQKLQEMHNTSNDYYMNISDFYKSSISSILGFSIICTANGFICNDCMVAIDDKGFKFKIAWGYSSNVTFVIYKLDVSSIHQYTISPSQINSGVISLSALSNFDKTAIGKKCLVDIHDASFNNNVSSIPNFGEFTKDGFVIKNIQNKTLANINKAKNISVTIHVLKYLYEVPNVYPAVNYYDITEACSVMNDKYEKAVDVNDNNIVGDRGYVINNTDVCTPPIILDRSTNLSFTTIVSCLSMYDDLISMEATFKSIGNIINMPNVTYQIFVDNVKIPLNDVYTKMIELYNTYIKGSILTSLIPYKSIERFKTLIDAVDNMRKVTDIKNIQLYTIDEYYGENYRFFVDAITLPFRNAALSNFSNLINISNNYFDNDECFNRPVSEQSFITLKYNAEHECWLFDSPTINHFKGIGNTFYVDDNLKGDEVFKFFVLYTETEDSTDAVVEPFNLDTVFDFDKFCEEVDKHIGYIRYWYAENKLMKLSKILYNQYNEETCTHVLSKILKRKIDGNDLIDVYQSDINYELSNVSSDNVLYYTDDTDRAPFAINFLFYTLSMLNDNEDKLQSYFFHKLTDAKFEKRYVDVDVSASLIACNDIFYPTNYSKFSIAPNTLDLSSSSFPTDKTVCCFYGLPIIANHDGSVLTPNMYRYTFNVYDNNLKHFSLSHNGIDDNSFVKYSNISQNGCVKYSYHNDIHLCKLVTLYLNYVYDYINELMTNYKTTYNQTSLIESGIESISKIVNDINLYKPSQDTHTHDTVINSITNDNIIISTLNQIKTSLADISTIYVYNKATNIVEHINRILSMIHIVYTTTGFDNYSLKNIQKLYNHLKKINTVMNLYSFKQWLSGIDLHLVASLDKVLAKNENYSLGSNAFTSLYVSLAGYVASTKTKIDTLSILIDSINTTIQINHIKPITEYCDDIISNYIFDLFRLDKIEYNNSLTYMTQPSLLKITLTNDSHFKPNIGQQIVGDVVLIFQPITEKVGSSYIIKSISKICDYAFFNGDKLDNCSMVVMNDNGDTITTISVNLSFKKINTTADDMNDFDQLVDTYKSSVEFQSVHESFSVNGANLIVNDSFANMNYEMLIGNHFTQLDCVHEKVLNLSTMLPGPVDKIYIPNELINEMTIDSFNSVHTHVYFKPSQIFHNTIELNTNVLKSVGGKFFVDQTIYLSTDDGLITFPAVVTCVDHAINKGFIEAKVVNSKWFEINDKSLITKYLTTNVTCNVVGDNIRNFLNEFNNSEYSNFTNVWFNPDMNYDEYSLPGDPVFVSNNTSYVYTRLNWFFNELVPNRFIDDEHKKHKFIYVGNGYINDINDDIKIKMINHNFSDMSNQEIYPILREEPNDHGVLAEELSVFKQKKNESEVKMATIKREIVFLNVALNNTKTEYERQDILNRIESAKHKVDYEVNFQKRMDDYMTQLEPATTWYNVRAYDDALVYISNGRAVTSPSFICDIKDIPFTDDLKVFIYDWEHKTWLNPIMYSTSINLVDSVKLYEYNDYVSDEVLHSITIKPNDGFVLSKQLLIYLSYDKSDVFDDIVMNDNSCKCRFKPLLSIDKPNQSKLYSDIRIRKHFNGVEEYVFDGYNKPEDFSIDNCLYLKRPINCGKYTPTPMIRMCDMSMTNNNVTYDFTHFDLYIRNPFKDVSSKTEFNIQTFNVTINKVIESFTPNKLIKLICVQNNDKASYNGNISNVMFGCMTSLVDSVPTLTVVNSSLSHDVIGSFICTVYKDNNHGMSSGVITINVNSTGEMLFNGNWVHIPNNDLAYKELPNECIFVPHDDVVMSTDKQSRIFFKNDYIKSSTDLITLNNSSLLNRFEYYYDTINKTRLPISNTKNNTYKERLVIDNTLNPDIKVIKSTYVSVCRYSLYVIPSNGFIDVTGYIPTPLSRKRYEVWVNGRCINPDNIIITSPTSFQLCNLTSLRNLELIELVDDLYNNELMKRDNVYIDLNGKPFSSYYKAFISNSNIVSQDIKFVYNINSHQNIHDYTSSILSNPNNKNIENDILKDIKFPEENDYDKLVNTPTINGVSIYNSTTNLLGIYEIPNGEILKSFDKTWMYERLTNPYFSITHQDEYQQYEMVTLKQRQSISDEFFIVNSSGNSDMYFTMYISNKSDGKIDDINNTLCIMPFIKVGMFVNINKSYKGKWLHTTFANSNVIRLK